MPEGQEGQIPEQAEVNPTEPDAELAELIKAIHQRTEIGMDSAKLDKIMALGEPRQAFTEGQVDGALKIVDAMKRAQERAGQPGVLEFFANISSPQTPDGSTVAPSTEASPQPPDPSGPSTHQ